jgi:hypothetical protein
MNAPAFGVIAAPYRVQGDEEGGGNRPPPGGASALDGSFDQVEGLTGLRGSRLSRLAVAASDEAVRAAGREKRPRPLFLQNEANSRPPASSVGTPWTAARADPLVLITDWNATGEVRPPSRFHGRAIAHIIARK